MAMPPIPMGDPMSLEAEDSMPEVAEDEEIEAGAEDLDPQFAAELSKCSYFADASDEDLACVQRAVLGLLGQG